MTNYFKKYPWGPMLKTKLLYGGHLGILIDANHIFYKRPSKEHSSSLQSNALVNNFKIFTHIKFVDGRHLRYPIDINNVSDHPMIIHILFRFNQISRF
jgi:hypothetical protein